MNQRLSGFGDVGTVRPYLKSQKGSLCDVSCKPGSPRNLLYCQEDWRKGLLCVNGREVKDLFSTLFIVFCDIAELSFIYGTDLFLFES